MKHRLERIASLIKEEVSLIFVYKLTDPTFGIITITDVVLSPDLKIAKIYLSVYDKSKREEVLSKVESVKSLIRGELASKVRMRFIPDLKFFIDDTLDHVEKIEELIKKIHIDDNKTDNNT